MTDVQTDIDYLNDILRGELSAVETYDQALKKMDDNGFVTAALKEALGSHHRRVTQLKEKISALGGSPTDGSGIWGGFAQLVQKGANLLGDGTAIATLEEGEDSGLKQYRTRLEELTPSTRVWVEALLAEQKRTHDAIAALQEKV